MSKSDLIKHDYKAEHELCSLMSARAIALGWKVFPETAGHDLLLVATEEVKTFNARAGDQIGIQAKLHANIEVVAQSMPRMHATRGPHFHAVLVPVATERFDTVATRCGILVMEATKRAWKDHRWRRERSVDAALRYLPPSLRNYYDEMEWHPEVAVLVPAGVKSPKSVTPWKVKAVRFCLDTLKRGFTTTADFMREGLSMTIWKTNGWIESTDERIGRSLKYRLVETTKPPHLKYPEITESLRQDMEVDEKLNKRKQNRIDL